MKTIKIDLLPEDFERNEFLGIFDCPLARAVKRHFKNKNVCVGPYCLNVGKNNYEVIDYFEYEDYQYVKAQYKKDPKAEKAIYYVTLKLMK